MSLNVPVSVKPRALKKTLRLQKIIEGLKQGYSFPKIAESCNCSEKTIDRDIAEWRDEGGFDRWLLQEFLRLHNQEVGKEDGGQAYRCITDLLKKRLVDRKEIHTEGNLSFNVNKEFAALIEFSRSPSDTVTEETGETAD